MSKLINAGWDPGRLNNKLYLEDRKFINNTLSENDIKNAKLTKREVQISTLRQYKSIIEY